MKGGLSEAYSYPSLAQSLLAVPQWAAQPKLQAGAQAWATRFFLEHTRGGAGPIQAALRLGERYYGGT